MQALFNKREFYILIVAYGPWGSVPLGASFVLNDTKEQGIYIRELTKNKFK